MIGIKTPRSHEISFICQSCLSEGRAKAQTVCPVAVPRPWAVIVFNKTPFSISQGSRCTACLQVVSWAHAQGVMTARRRRRKSIFRAGLMLGSPRFSAAGDKLCRLTCWSKPAGAESLQPLCHSLQDSARQATWRALRQDPCQVGLKLKLKEIIDDDDDDDMGV